MANKKLIFTCLLSLLFLAGCFAVVFYSHKYAYWYRVGPIAVTYLSIVGLCAVWISDSKTSKSKQTLGGFFLLLLIIGLYYLLTGLQTRYLNYQLEKYGTVAYARVISIQRERSRYSTNYYAIITYDCAGGNYLQRVHDNNDFYKYHDSIRLVCSSHDPEIFRVTGYKPALKLKY